MSTLRLPINVAFAVLVIVLSPAARDASGEPTGPRAIPTANGRLAFLPRRHLDRERRREPAAASPRTSAATSRRFSPDGKMIAFTSNRMGNDDVRRPASGGELRQVTFNTVNDTVLYWSPDGRRVIFATQRGDRPWEARSTAFRWTAGCRSRSRWTQRQPE